MPKTKRDLMKRQLAHAYNNFNLAGGHLQVVIDEFKPVHPELAEGLELCQALILQAMNLLVAFATIAWNNPSPDWDSWRNEPR